MRLHPTFRDKLGLESADEVFAFIRNTLKPRLAKPSYFVDWEKVKRNTTHVKMSLHQLDYVLSEPDKEIALAEVLRENPKTVEALPYIFASREHEFMVMPETVGDYLDIDEYTFSVSNVQTEEGIQKIVKFCKLIGLLKFVEEAAITSFTDFVYGVEAGLDTHGRKNRGGVQMEDIVEYHVRQVCKAQNYHYLTQATARDIRAKFGKTLTVDKSERRIDFAINTPQRLHLIETNFYGGGGSKLKATAGEYKGLYDSVTKDGHQFIWVTDGKGWLTALLPLRETFNYTDYIINLEMLGRGVLEDLLLDSATA